MMTMTARQKQLLLAFLGYYTGAIDGIYGPASQKAEERFREDHMRAGQELCRRLREVIGTGGEGESFWQSVRHFRREEFRCRCGRCGGFPAEPAEGLIRAADTLREKLGSPIVVSSGVRCPEHNRAVGGVANSRHLTGKAMDFACDGCGAGKILGEVKDLSGIRYAYAIDENHVHMDIG